MREIKKGSDFSGVGAFDFALDRIAETKGFKVKNVFACDWDKHARVSYLANHPEPEDYPKDVYEREIPNESLDIYMTSPPCQAFSIAGKRKGKEDQRGILFFNSHEFIQKNKPRFFIFENVKGLLSDDKKNKDDKFGRTFNEWINLLGGKSVNGLPILFPYEDSVPYHIYYKTINTKDHGIPQNRERVFIIGIRDDSDNQFTFPKEEQLKLRLKDVLEETVASKYFLIEKLIAGFMVHKDRHEEKGTGFKWKPKTEDDIANTLRANAALCPTDNSIKVKSATKLGYEIAKPGDSINTFNIKSETRRGRVGKGVAQTLDTACNQAIWSADFRYDEGLRIRKGDASLCVTTTEPIYTNSPQIRRLTPRECFRLQDFPDSFTDNIKLSNNANKQGIFIIFEENKDLCQNVKEVIVKGMQSQKDIALCTIKDLKNMEMQTSSLSTKTGSKESVKLKAVIQVFTQTNIAQSITSQIINTETLYTWKTKQKKIEIIKRNVGEGGLKTVKESIGQLWKINLDANLKKASAYIISTVIHTIMTKATCMYS